MDLVVTCHGDAWANDPVGQISSRAVTATGRAVSRVGFGGKPCTNCAPVWASRSRDHPAACSPRIAPWPNCATSGGLFCRTRGTCPAGGRFRTLNRLKYTDICNLTARPAAPWARANANDSRCAAPVAARFLKARRGAFTVNQLWPTQRAHQSKRLSWCFLAGWAPADSQPKPLRPRLLRQQGCGMRWATAETPAARLTPDQNRFYRQR